MKNKILETIDSLEHNEKCALDPKTLAWKTIPQPGSVAFICVLCYSKMLLQGIELLVPVSTSDDDYSVN